MDKMCFYYPTINISWHPSTPHKGVDGVTRSVSNSSLPSRDASLLCKELRGNHSGPMGSAGNNGIQIRFAQDPHQAETSCATSLPNRPCSDNRGGSGTVSQTSYKGSTNLPQQFHIPTLPCGKERGWAKTSYQSESSEQLRALRALQDGRLPYSPRSYSDWWLYDQTGSERCISLDPNPSGSPTPPILVGGKDIPVHVSPLRTDISQSIRITNTSSNFSGRKRHTSSCVSPSDWHQLQGFLPRCSNHHLEYFNRWGFGELSIWTTSLSPSKQGGVKMFSFSDLQPVWSSGFADQHQKFILTPEQATEFLGFLINSVTLQIQMPQERN